MSKDRYVFAKLDDDTYLIVAIAGNPKSIREFIQTPEHDLDDADRGKIKKKETLLRRIANIYRAKTPKGEVWGLALTDDFNRVLYATTDVRHFEQVYQRCHLRLAELCARHKREE